MEYYLKYGKVGMATVAVGAVGRVGRAARARRLMAADALSDAETRAITEELLQRLGSAEMANVPLDHFTELTPPSHLNITHIAPVFQVAPPLSSEALLSPIPLFDPFGRLRRELPVLGRDCMEELASAIDGADPDHVRSMATLRSKVREILIHELA